MLAPVPTVTRPPGFVTFSPCHRVSAPRAGLLAAVTVVSHTATLPAPGTLPPTQLAGSLRAVALLALRISAAWAENATEAMAAMVKVRERLMGGRFVLRATPGVMPEMADPRQPDRMAPKGQWGNPTRCCAAFVRW